ncbi:hypothetical protein [Paraliobacillus sp. JSM ZJ581]|uniref:hypothetical protein n=1 Tax=Paraliobacillus sp. JSM ZJ581 TaxID=3342118 RepID=UPI0035A8C5EC
MNKKEAIAMDQINRKFEQLYRKLQVVEQKLATKADDIVLTMVLNQRHDMEELQTEIKQLKSEIGQLSVAHNYKRYTIKRTKNTKKPLKLLPFLQKS